MSCKEDNGLIFLNSYINLKKVKAGSLNKVTFHCKNSTNHAIRIEDISTECDCIAPDRKQMEIPAGETRSIQITFQVSKSLLGSQERQIVVRTGEKPSLNLLKIGCVVIE